MKIRDLSDVCVVDIDRRSISKEEICNLESILRKKARLKRVGLNLQNVTSLSHEFGSLLQSFSSKSKLSLFNMNNDALLFLYITKYDKSVNIYMDEDDFQGDKRSLVNRRFKVVSSA